MDLSGNIALLDRPLVAFFASRSATTDALDRALCWSEQIIHSDKVVISGFHSPVERAVLDRLLAARQPFIVALGRTLYRRIPAHLQQPFTEGWMLFLSFRNQTRPSQDNSLVRNWAIADLADELVFAPFEPNSRLDTLHFTYAGGNTPTRIL